MSSIRIPLCCKRKGGVLFLTREERSFLLKTIVLFLSNLSYKQRNFVSPILGLYIRTAGRKGFIMIVNHSVGDRYIKLLRDHLFSHNSLHRKLKEEATPAIKLGI